MPGIIDKDTTAEWNKLHARNYHGTYKDVHKRNKAMWESNEVPMDADSVNLFSFSPAGKTICDIGAGGGWHGLECLRKGAKMVHLLEVNHRIVEQMALSFQELNVPEDSYNIIHVEDQPPVLPLVDIVYCMAVFQHIHKWQVEEWLRWTARTLKPDGEAHLQFYQPDGYNYFFNSQEKTTLSHLDEMIESCGLRTSIRKLAVSETNPNFLPVWYLYKCKRRQ